MSDKLDDLAAEIRIAQDAKLKLFAKLLMNAQAIVHDRNQKWWQDPATGQRIERNVGELLMLIVSEVAEAMEGYRKNLPDEHLKNRLSIEVEMADVLIRILDFCGGLNLDLAGAFVQKMEYNRLRVDHTHAARLAPGGKKF